ncbi:MAG: type I glyceraldehyde-3-phosphate dehydrogenase [Candidatus Zambryskibacteria bacterium]|nr:type I glyceraldehyde-3-phosphate dehydrogenase [Candidatus Zambryskibacteria bacterium]
MKIAINGAGRIGRSFLRLALDAEGLSKVDRKIEIIAINDLGDIDNIAYLLKYDTVYGVSPLKISVNEDKKSISVNEKKIEFLSEKNPANLPWRHLDIDVVVESTGVFATYKKSQAHIEAGAKRVIITAPVKDDPIDESQVMVLMGINDDKLVKAQISSNASCTTNAAGPIVQILNEKLGIEKAILNTTHALTASQTTVDGPKAKDWKEGRAGAHNIVPTSTGAAKAVGKVISEIKDKFDGISMRVPVIAGSIADITFISKKETSVEEVNKILKDAAQEEKWQGIFTATDEKLVSSDIVGSLYGSIADLGLTRVVGGNLVKVCVWYDNEMGYTNTLLKHILKIGKYLEVNSSEVGLS